MNQDKQRIKNALKELLDGKKRVVEIEISNKKNINLRPFRAWYNKLVVIVTQKIPPMWFKSFLLKSTGLNLGDEVCIPMYNYFDVYFPELITIKGNTLIGGLSQYYAHEFKEEDGKLKLVLGKIFVDENVLVSGGAKLYPGSYVNKNISPRKIHPLCKFQR